MTITSKIPWILLDHGLFDLGEHVQVVSGTHTLGMRKNEVAIGQRLHNDWPVMMIDFIKTNTCHTQIEKAAITMHCRWERHEAAEEGCHHF